MRFLFFILFLTAWSGFASNAQTSVDTLFESSVSELMELSPRTRSGSYIESASKQAESIFDAPVSASVITREEIQNAGCLSIPEALRLMPGVIVREVSNGAYQVKVRGFNDLPPGSSFFNREGTDALLMIDYRPIFNYVSGGVFWEFLPISIQDIERIELVRGPGTALYGANVVTGVIHIITRRAKREGAISYGNVELGNNSSYRLNTAAGYAWNSKSQFILSGNLTQRRRFTTQLYDILDKTYTANLEEITGWRTGDSLDFETAFPRLEKGIERFGINAYLQINPLEDLLVDFSAGYENSITLKPFIENGFTPLSTLRSETWYINSRNQFKNGLLQASFMRGTQETGVSFLGYKYDLHVLDINAEYDFEWGNLRIKPGFSYRDAVADDRKYESAADSTEATGLINGIKHINNIAVSLRSDYTWKDFRFIAALRWDRFSIPRDGYFSFQLAANYKLKDKHLLRLVFSKANRGSTILEVLSNSRGAVELDQPFPGAATLNLGVADPREKLIVSRNMEFGYRYQPHEKVFIDLEAFWADAQNFGSVIPEISTDTLVYQGQSRIFFLPTFRQRTLDLIAIQRGVTFSLNYTPTSKTQIRIFGSLQTTRLKNFSPFYVDPSISETQNLLTQEDVNDYEGTPRLFGGFYFHHGIGKYWQVNLNGYYFTSHEINHLSDTFLEREANFAEIEGKLLLNIVLTFRPYKGLKLYGNLRNLLGMNTFEYYFTDRVGRTFTGGLTYEF